MQSTHTFHTSILLLLLALCAACDNSVNSPDVPAEVAVTGNIIGNTGYPLSDVIITLRNAETALSDTTGIDGIFALDAVDVSSPAWLIPEKSDYIFSPDSLSLSGYDGSHITLFGFGPDKNLIKIAGLITDELRRPLKTTVILHSDSISDTLTTNREGVYYWTTTQDGDYTIVPIVSDILTYEPETVTLNGLKTGDVRACNFTGTLTVPMHDVSGRALDESGETINDVVYISLTNENYSFYVYSHMPDFTFKNVPAGIYTLTLSSAYYEFDTVTIEVTDSSVRLSDQKGVYNYTGPTQYTLTVQVTDCDGNGIADTSIDAYRIKQMGRLQEKEWVYNGITDNNGKLSWPIYINSKNSEPTEDSFFVKPQKEGFAFEPDSVSVTICSQPGIKDGGTLTIAEFTATDYSSYHPDSFCPLDEGTQWTFTFTDNQGNTDKLEMTVNGTEAAGGFAYFRFAPTGPGGMGLLRVDSEDVRAWDGDEDIVLLRFGVVPGTEWESGHDDAGYDRTGVFHGLADVTVPAGTFSDCLRFESRLIWRKTSYESHEMWFAEDAGLVRQVRTLVNYGNEIERMEMELRTYGGR